MGKIGTIFIMLLMINIVGYILMSDYVGDSDNPYIQSNSLLTTLYTPTASPDGGNVYVVGADSEFYGSVPQEPPDSFLDSTITFIDRIFLLFDFVRMLLGVLLFPIALISFLGVQWQLSMILLTPLTGLYIIGIIDLFGGGDN